MEKESMVNMPERKTFRLHSNIIAKAIHLYVANYVLEKLSKFTIIIIKYEIV